MCTTRLLKLQAHVQLGADSAPHLVQGELEQLVGEKADFKRVEPMELKMPDNMEHSVPMEDHPALPMPSADVFNTGVGFVDLHWRCAAETYLSEKQCQSNAKAMQLESIRS